MITYGLHAHELDPGKATGIARYARELASALGDVTSPDERVSLVTARDCGSVTSHHQVIDAKRRTLYLRWLATRRPLIERLVDLDLLHVTAPIVPMGTHKPTVVTIHDVTPMTHPDWYSRTSAFNFRQTVDWARRRADAVIVPSTFVAQQVINAGFDESRVHLTRYGVDTSHLHVGGGDALDGLGLAGQQYLLYLGAVTVRKNLTTLIEALPPDGPLLVLAGPDAVGAQDVHRAAEGTAARVRLLGRVSDEQVAALLKGAMALVHPSSSEGFGLTVLEAMSFGTPVVVSSGGSLPEVVGDAGHVVESNDVTGWREGLSVVRDADRLERLAAGGPAWAAGWTWGATAAATLSVYRKVLGAAP